MPRGVGDIARLERGVAGEAVLRLLWLLEFEVLRADHMQPVGREQLHDLAHLAGVVAGHNQCVAGAKLHEAVTFFCRSTSSPMPLRASFKSCANSSSLNGAPSA